MKEINDWLNEQSKHPFYQSAITIVADNLLQELFYRRLILLDKKLRDVTADAMRLDVLNITNRETMITIAVHLTTILDYNAVLRKDIADAKTENAYLKQLLSGLEVSETNAKFAFGVLLNKLKAIDVAKKVCDAISD